MDTLLLFKCDRKHTYIFHNLIDGVFLGISAVQLVHQVRDCNVTSTIYVRIYDISMFIHNMFKHTH